MVQLACETDFVAKTDKFQEGLKGIMQTIHAQDLMITGQRCADEDFLKKICQDTKMVSPLDSDVASQTIEDGLKYTISKTQENIQLVKVFQAAWNPSEGEVMQAYIHGQTEKGSGIGKIGTIVHLSREDKKISEALDKMATQLAMHIAAMKPAFLKEEDIPESVKNEILEGEGGERALKKYIKRDVMWMQELATAQEGSDTVGKFLQGKGKQMKTKIEVENWALFMIA